MESTFVVNSNDILVICSESAHCWLITFIPRAILVGLPDVCSNTGILEFILKDDIWEQNLEVLIVGQKSKTEVETCSEWRQMLGTWVYWEKGLGYEGNISAENIYMFLIVCKASEEFKNYFSSGHDIYFSTYSQVNLFMKKLFINKHYSFILILRKYLSDASFLSYVSPCLWIPFSALVLFPDSELWLTNLE